MYRLVATLLEPYTLLCLLTGLALVALWRGGRAGRRSWAVAAPFGVLLLASTPAVSYVALGSLEWQNPARPERPADVGAIVVLGGGMTVPDGPQLGEDTLARCVAAARAYRRGGACPVVASGGRVGADEPGPALAEAMSGLLVDLGVSPGDVIVEDRSRTTYENAVECARLLKERQVHKVLLVTDAVHMPRARGCFERQGLEVVAGPCRFQTAWGGGVGAFLPGPEAAAGCQQAAHEWLGLAWYLVCGRI